MKRLGRPPAYDRDQALEAALGVFRREGFGATSLEDLAAATGMNRPSLYAAFGDKQQLYLAAMDRFIDRTALAAATALGDGELQQRPSVRLEKLFEVVESLYLEGGLGCAVMSSAPSEVFRDPSFREKLQQVLRLIDEQIRKTLRQALMVGALSSRANIDHLSAIVAAALHSIALRARAGNDDDAIRIVSQAAVEAVREYET